MNKYSPIESLREEVERFKSTNTFNPLLVTNFYAQASCVLNYVQELEAKIQELIERHEGEIGVVESAKRLIKRYE